MLSLLPAIGYFGILLNLALIERERGIRSLILRAAIVWATVSVILLEILSLLGFITKLGLSTSWIFLIAVEVAGIVRAHRRGMRLSIPRIRIPSAWFARLALLAILAICAITFTVAWVAPPNTWDSLTYHMSRVAHWAQNRSLRHFATGIERQNLMSPGAELLVLQGYMLSGTDRLANLTEWSAMVISLIGVSHIAQQLGSDQRGQIFASLFAATLPMGIAQASSTMTDYVVALWMVCLTSEAIDFLMQTESPVSLAFMGLAAGLAVLTKPIAFAYLAPYAALMTIAIIKRQGLRRFCIGVAIVSLCVMGINFGYFARNLLHYGNPIGSNERVENHANEIMNWRVVISNVLRNASLHAGTSNEEANDVLYMLLAKVHAKLDLNMTDPRTTIHPEFRIFKPSADENLAGNPIHSILILMTAPLVLAQGRRDQPVTVFGVVVYAGFIILSAMIQFSIFASRYHLPFFVLCAPLVARSLDRPPHRIVQPALAALVLIGTWDMLFHISNRPLLPQSGAGRSILTVPRDRYLLPGDIARIYQEMTDMIDSTGCSKVGIMILGNSPEYPLWVFLGAPRQDLQMEWIIGEDDPSSEYRKLEFQPCAVICEKCPEQWETLRDLPIVLEHSRYRLYSDLE